MTNNVQLDEEDDEEICGKCNSPLEDGECQNIHCSECPDYDYDCSECGKELDENGVCQNVNCSNFEVYSDEEDYSDSDEVVE